MLSSLRPLFLRQLYGGDRQLHRKQVLWRKSLCIGYSINDTVVIFDRVREYNGLYPKREKKVNINDALNNTLSRTFSTSMSTFVVLLAIFIFGGETIRGFVFALLMGVIVGTYSSLFIASPIAYEIQLAQARRAERKAAAKK